jgi:ATP-binding cassette subfamily C protein CydD
LIEGVMDFRTGLLVLLLTPEFYLPFRLFGASHHAGMEGAAAGERIFDLLQGEVEPEDDCARAHQPQVWRAGMLPNGSAAAAHAILAPAHIRFENVDFRYPESPEPAVRGLNFELQPGRTHLLAGESGAGKSTVMKLLLRFLQPTNGDLVVNGRSLQEIAPELWRSQVVFVSQHPHFFEGSVLDNLRAARLQATLDQVRTAARLAETDDFIMALPQGYDTPIGEAAARFSSGERQRLAIARAFLKDSPVLLFDEPTSHLDGATAVRLQRTFHRLAAQRTTLIIAHHGLTLLRPDIVFVLSGGRLVDSNEQSLPAPFFGSASYVEWINQEARTR